MLFLIFFAFFLFSLLLLIVLSKISELKNYAMSIYKYCYKFVLSLHEIMDFEGCYDY
ncbi:hypothetical protein SCH_4344 [Salmonella enterica subsp. enterica serovar Choleraesuis str. SC-B67]|uniref:Uncharacterized protein n=1 Tax=Salmonella choleraesuis (strain SC-B67) TaxID=321314 RepID=Q57GB2_SALCH|nr:hypothetical protein SCH_4344 [Salmonella enterica subsp. enterica serovar Choleraesuis str. SC-B67]